MATVETASESVSGRIGNGLLFVGGLSLVGLMAYTLLYDARPARPATTAGALEVAVVLPSRDDWHNVRQGVLACVRDELLELREDGTDSVTVQVPGKRGRLIRFAWRRAPGVVETREVVDRLLSRPSPPAAVMGSSNTTLTAALAEALRDLGGARPGGPLLLVPWATSTFSRGETRLLGIDAGRTFRFGLDNRRLAQLVVGCVQAREPARPPHSVLIVVDPADPYSIDLADGFEAAIRRAAPGVEIVKEEDGHSSPGLGYAPGRTDARLAARVWERARAAPEGSSTWLVLPLQGAPTRRILTALDGRAPAEPPALHVLSGDGIGLTTLFDFTRLRSLSVWCGSSNAAPADDDSTINMPPTALVLAEAVSALSLAVARAGAGPDGLRDALAAIDLAADDPAAFGRPLAFDESGERRGPGIGHVLAVRRGEDTVEAFAPRPDGSWAGPVEAPDPMIPLEP